MKKVITLVNNLVHQQEIEKQLDEQRKKRLEESTKYIISVLKSCKDCIQLKNTFEWGKNFIERFAFLFDDYKKANILLEYEYNNLTKVIYKRAERQTILKQCRNNRCTSLLVINRKDEYKMCRI